MSAAVTVVVPTIASRHQLLQRALDSIAAQTFRDFEIWVMPDGPDPGLTELRLPPQTQIIGLGRRWQRWGAVQKLVAGYLCQSPYMAYVHDDDYWRPNHLELLMAAFTDPLRGRHEDHQGDPIYPDFCYSKIDWCGSIIGTDPPACGQIDTGCIVHRTDLLQTSTWEADGPYVLDWELVERWIAAGARWRFVPEVTLVYPEKREGR